MANVLALTGPLCTSCTCLHAVASHPSTSLNGPVWPQSSVIFILFGFIFVVLGLSLIFMWFIFDFISLFFIFFFMLFYFILF